MGSGYERCGAISSKFALSNSASLTIRYCSKSAPNIAACRYRTPPWISLVDLEEVPDEKSSYSTRAVLSPRVVESSATPAPVAPPPITRISYSSSFKHLIISFRGGRALDGRLFNSVKISACAVWVIPKWFI